MGLMNRVFFLVLAIVAGMSLAGCGKQCPTTSLGSSSGSSGSGGGVNTGGSVCGSGPTGPGAGSISAFLYYFALDNNGVGNIEGAGLSNAGTLSPLNPYTPPTLPSNGTDNMVIVNKQFLYIPMGDSTVQAFTISHTNGALTPIAGSPFSTAGQSADTAVSDPQGRFLFVGSEVIGLITVFQINATSGVLTTTGTFSGVNMSSADSLAVDGKGKFLYAGQGNATTPIPPIFAFSIDQNIGALTEINGSPFNLNVATVHADSSGKFLLGVQGILDAGNPNNDTHIYVFSIDPLAGTPTPVANSPFLTTAAPFEFAIHPNGQFVYTFGTSAGATAALEGYQLSSTGTLTALPNSPFTTLSIVQDCQLDQSGGVAFCVNAIFSGTAFSVLTLNPTTGALTSGGQNLTVVNTFPFAVTD